MSAWYNPRALVRVTLLLSLSIVALVLLSMVHHRYEEAFIRCRQQKDVAISILSSSLCTDPQVRDMAKEYNNVDCLHAEGQLRIPVRTCALGSLVGAVYKRMTGTLFREIGEKYNILTTPWVILFLWPSFGVVILLYYLNQKEVTRRNMLENQSRDRQSRQQTELVQQMLSLQYETVQNQQQQQHALHNRPFVEEVREWDDDGRRLQLKQRSHRRSSSASSADVGHRRARGRSPPGRYSRGYRASTYRRSELFQDVDGSESSLEEDSEGGHLAESPPVPRSKI